MARKAQDSSEGLVTLAVPQPLKTHHLDLVLIMTAEIETAKRVLKERSWPGRMV